MEVIRCQIQYYLSYNNIVFQYPPKDSVKLLISNYHVNDAMISGVFFADESNLIEFNLPVKLNKLR